MQISELISIGKLGKSIDSKGFIPFRIKRNFRSILFELKDIFLVFTDHRVRYVTVDKIEADQNIKIRIIERDVTYEAVNNGRVQVMLPSKDFGNILEEKGFLVNTGSQINYNNQEIGKVVDVFNNKAHDVLVVEMLNGQEIMIPYVDYFIIKKVDKIIYVQNIHDFLEL